MAFPCTGSLVKLQERSGAQFPRYISLHRSTGQNLRYWHQESPLQFFRIYPLKSYLQKQASLSMLPSASLQSLPTSQFPPWRSSNIDTQTEAGGYIQIFSANSEGSLVINSLIDELFGFDLRTLRNAQKSNPHHPREQMVICKGEMYIGSKMYKIYNSDIYILGHMIYSVVFMFPNDNWCLFIRLQKLPLELSVLIKYPLFFKLLYILINTNLQRVT